MDDSYIEPFVQATQETFQTMLSVDVEPGKAYIKKKLLLNYDVSGAIGISGGAQGLIALCFTEPVALKIVSSLIGMDFDVPQTEVMDAVGELANIIAGYAKKNLKDFTYTISLPNVVVGKNHVITVGRIGVPTSIVPLKCRFGEFALEVTIRPV